MWKSPSGMQGCKYLWQKLLFLYLKEFLVIRGRDLPMSWGRHGAEAQGEANFGYKFLSKWNDLQFPLITISLEEHNLIDQEINYTF